MDILDKWLDDLPQQFQGKKYIEDLISVFAKQLEDLHRVFGQLDTETDLESAVGANLDMVGDILALSRKEAKRIIRKAKEFEMNDGLYRNVLKYKALVNSCDCTYYDIMESISLLWNTDNIVYVEPRDRPATVLLTLPTVSLDAMDPAIGKILTIKASGVALLYTISYWERILMSVIERFYLSKVNNRFSFNTHNKHIISHVCIHAIFNQTYHTDLDGMVISKRNIWYLNGQQQLDGSKYLNAIEKKEVF